MKPHWSELTKEQQATFGDGCTFVPDFIFTANCRQHDFNYERGGNLFDKFKADNDLCMCMIHDATKWYHILLTFLYWAGLTFLPFSYFYFAWGRYKTLEEILLEDDKFNRGY